MNQRPDEDNIARHPPQKKWREILPRLRSIKTENVGGFHRYPNSEWESHAQTMSRHHD